MSTSSKTASRTIENMLRKAPMADLVRLISPTPVSSVPLRPEIPEIRNWTHEAQRRRADLMQIECGLRLPALTTIADQVHTEELRGNIENFIGMTQIPTGLIGPLRVNGTAAKGDFYVPLATSEGALVASYHRGALAASKCGGVTSVCLTEMVQRTPSFKFRTFAEGGPFLIWCMQNVDKFREVAAQHTSHGVLEEVRPNVDGNQITLILEYSTGDASGQNMSTICTEAVCKYIIEHTPFKPLHWYVEGNLSGDKKATALSFTSVRGKKVTSEIILSREIIEHDLHSSAEQMMEYWKTSVLNGIQSGSIGVNGHYANGLAALFVACGQDIACVSEASVGTTRFDVTEDGGLYVSVTLPNLIVGTVGGGTGLPTQKECLQIMDCYGDGKARKLAEICAATVLCGEISIVASIASGTFSKAHALFGRKRKSEPKA
jgi:hydroxymethylglutaryl-CoA reductase (NADPH)